MMSDQNIFTQGQEAAVRNALQSGSIVLVGLMGAGKSAIGRKLAERLDLPFIDADTEIEVAAKQTIAEIFANYGEEEFRRLEVRVIERILHDGPLVLATGGGAFMNEETRATIALNGISVWLSADLDLLMSRVMRKATRPLLKNPDPRGVMRDLMEKRYPIYRLAELEVPSRDVSKDDMVDAVVAALHGHFQDKGVLQGDGQ